MPIKRTTAITYTTVVLLLFTILLPVGSALSDSAWPSAGRDPANTRFSPYSMEDFSGVTIWTYSTERSITTTPIIGTDGTIYVASVDNNLYALTPGGMLRWSFTAGSDLRASPLFAADGTIYIIDWEGTLFSIDQEGNLNWKVEYGLRPGGPPQMGIDGNIYITTTNGVIHAINPNGKTLWTFETKQNLASSPVIDTDGTLYIATQRGWEDTHGILYAISSTGDELMSTEIPTSVISEATIGFDDNIYFGGNDGRLYAYSKTGDILWTYETDNRIASSPAVTPGGTIYVSSFDRHLHAVNSDGNLLWKFETDSYISASPTVSADGRIFFGSSDNYFYILESDGSLFKKIDLDTSVLSSASISSNGIVYVGDNDGTIFALNGHMETDRIPSSPLSISAQTTKDDHINLTWEPPIEGESTHYNIYRKEGDGLERYMVSVRNPMTEYRDTTIEPGIEYTYRITAENKLGESSPGEPVTISISLPEEEQQGTGRIFIGIIAFLSALCLILTIQVFRLKRTVNRKQKGWKKEREGLKGNASTCPFCGHYYIEGENNNEYGRCPQCKELIRPPVF